MSEYKYLEGFSNYQICRDGYVLNLKTGNVLYGNRKKTGYYELSLLADDGSRHYFLVHRLIAGAFLPMPADAEEVNHKDGNKANNAADNLEWVTHAENLTHAFASGLRSDDVSPRAVVATNMDTGEQIEFGSIYRAARFLGISQGNICMCCKGLRPYASGFYWAYAEDGE